MKKQSFFSNHLLTLNYFLPQHLDIRLSNPAHGDYNEFHELQFFVYVYQIFPDTLGLQVPYLAKLQLDKQKADYSDLLAVILQFQKSMFHKFPLVNQESFQHR